MNTEQMIRELSIVFPSLRMRPLSDFGPAWVGQEGIWTGGGEAQMPDGEPIFDICDRLGCDEHDMGVHNGFTAWLALRGWAHDRYDNGTFFLVPNSYFDEPMGPEPRESFEYRAAFELRAASLAVHDDGCPF